MGYCEGEIRNTYTEEKMTEIYERDIHFEMHWDCHCHIYTQQNCEYLPGARCLYCPFLALQKSTVKAKQDGYREH